MYNGSLADSFQFAISVNCFSLLLIISGVYFAYYLQTKEKTFFAGCLITFNVMLFVLAETLIIVTGWNNNIPLGRHLHRAEQVAIFMFLASLPYFLQNIFQIEGRLKKAFSFLFWLGFSITVVTALTAYIFPESLISLTAPSKTPPVSPGDFTRGLEGPLFIVRDIMLAVYIVVSLIYSFFHIIKKSRSFQSIAMFLGIVVSILGGLDDMQYVYSGNNFFLNELRFSRFVLGSTIMLLFFLAAVFSKYFTAHTMLEKTTHELEVSENKYSLLMDAANEIMFSLSLIHI